MSLDPPAYILSLQNNIRNRPISWEGAVRARTISENDLKQIKAIDKVRVEQRKQALDANRDEYTQLFLGDGWGNRQSIFQAASSAKRVDIVQYLLVLLGDLVDNFPDFTKALLSHQHPYDPLLPLLTQSSQNPDQDPVPLLASSVLASLMSQAIASHSSFSHPLPPHLSDGLPTMFKYISGLAKNSDSGRQDIAVQEYSALLRSAPARQVFWKHRHDTLNPLIEILRAAAGTSGKSGDSSETNTLANGSGVASMSSRTLASETTLSGGVNLQLLYHVLLVIWQLSFEGEEIAQGLDEEQNILPLYTTLIRTSPKEKTTRLLLSTLRNLLPSSTSPLLPSAASSRLPSTLSVLKTRKLTDEDLLNDLDSLQSLITEYSQSQTTLSQYASEVQGGHLLWSPPHRDAKFWRENARKICEDNSGALVKKLAEIMEKKWEADRNVLAVACNDVGCLVRECPDKRAFMEKLGLKGRVMALMTEEEEGVRWEALRATGEWLRYGGVGQ